jgi:hypothetical protein
MSTAAMKLASPDSYALASWLFLRLLGVIYFSAFLSLAFQLKGLVGRQGILPAVEFLAARRRFGARRFWRVPTLCWFNSSDPFMLGICWTGVVLAACLVAGLFPMAILILLWLAYLSLFSIGRIFLGYQWDILLLETGFLAIFAAPTDLSRWCPPAVSPPPIIIWLLWWLLFRLMFSSGVVKFRSADEHWRRLTALAFHYETQPLPTPVAWHAHQLPIGWHRVSATVMFAIELLAPWLIFGPPPLKYTAAGLIVLLMILIQLTGNYCFFNLLAIALSLLLLDDRALFPIFGGLVPARALVARIEPTQWFQAGVGILVLALSLVPLARLARLEISWPRPLESLFDFFEPFHLVNSYGLFSVMTTERPEIIVEGSQDGVLWLPYEFKWKPGDPWHAPRFIAPHQPRLDWQMWFAALGFADGNPWFLRFLKTLQQGSPSVLSLLKENPFPNRPPRFIRAVMYRYRFTNFAQRRKDGSWWSREKRGLYCPVLEAGEPTNR